MQKSIWKLINTSILFLILLPFSYANVGIIETSRKITVMSYNVENLFDTTHDEGKNDYTYLPLAVKNRSPEVQEYCRRMSNEYWKRECFNLDWNPNILRKKIRQLSRVIKLANNGNGPDILVLQEVENINVLNMLNTIGLKKCKYKEVVLLEGPDRRGIDVAILSKFPLATSPKLHQIDLSPAYPGSSARPTRGILEATFKIYGSPITVLANHWSSQGNIDLTRLIAAKTLFKITKNINNPVIAAGDFNTLKDDDPHGINEYVLNPHREPSYYDSEQVHFGDTNDPERGTHWYRGKWSSLDRIFFLRKTTGCTCQNPTVCLTPDWSSFQIIKQDFMLRDITWEDWDTGETTVYRDIPWRFNASTGEGYSDHLPILISFYVN